MAKTNNSFTFVVIGGGIAGISCVETLSLLNENLDILLITKSSFVKTATSALQITKTIVKLNVEEVQVDTIENKFKNVKIIIDTVVKLNHVEKTVETKENGKISFEKLCICTGGKPNLILHSSLPVIGLRDTESVMEFEKKIKSARKIMIVGNGGIASEIIHEVKGVDKIWVVKDKHISKTFIDAGAAEFFKSVLEEEKNDSSNTTIIKRITYKTSVLSTGSSCSNPALGPDWHKNFYLRGSKKNANVVVEYETEVSEVVAGDEQWPICVKLTNNKCYYVDLIISATGVIPNSEVFIQNNENLYIAPDKGISVDHKMETTLKDVFAAGDVCTASWEIAPHWFQMRLWTQARQMGCYSAKCMMASLTNEPVLQDFCFELFSHVTKLFGFKVVLLGLYNAQKLDNDYELLLRMTKAKEYVKLVLKNGKLQGALLIGETDLEEMCENLILNQLDLTPFGDDLLNPDIDIEDYFD